MEQIFDLVEGYLVRVGRVVSDPTDLVRLLFVRIGQDVRREGVDTVGIGRCPSNLARIRGVNELESGLREAPLNNLLSHVK